MKLWFERALLSDGWAECVELNLEHGLIANIATGVDAAPEAARGAVAVSGLCNVHSHAFQRGMAGLSERRGKPEDDFWSWREIMYRFLDRLDPEAIEAIAAQAYVEMLESGFTRVGEFHYLHNAPDGRPYAAPAETAQSIVAAAEAAGIGLTLLPVFYAHGGFNGALPTPGQRRFLTDLDQFARLLDDTRALLRKGDQLGLAPHSLRAVTPAQLSALTDSFAEGPIHIHAAEQLKEVNDCVAALGARPVEWLLSNAEINARWCLIHATHITEAECASLAKSGAVAGLCPITEANLGDGVFPAAAYLAAGGAFATGSDSNIQIDAAAELRQLEYSQRLTQKRRNVLASETSASVGRTLFERACKGGAQALGVQAGLTVGAQADIVSFNCKHPALLAAHGDAMLDSWIFAARERVVDCVWARGRLVVREGRHIAAEPIGLRYADALARLVA